jgi:hypothetical protein
VEKRLEVEIDYAFIDSDYFKGKTLSEKGMR